MKQENLKVIPSKALQEFLLTNKADRFMSEERMSFYNNRKELREAVIQKLKSEGIKFQERILLINISLMKQLKILIFINNMLSKLFIINHLLIF